MSMDLIKRIEDMYPAENKFADEGELLRRNKASLFARRLRSGKEFIGTEYEKDEEVESDNKV